METYDLEDFRYNSVNITAFRLVDVNSKRYLEVIDQMQKIQHNGLENINGKPYIKVFIIYLLQFLVQIWTMIFRQSLH